MISIEIFNEKMKREISAEANNHLVQIVNHLFRIDRVGFASLRVNARGNRAHAHTHTHTQTCKWLRQGKKFKAPSLYLHVLYSRHRYYRNNPCRIELKGGEKSISPATYSVRARIKAFSLDFSYRKKKAVG